MFKRVARKNTAGITRVLTASGEHGLIDQGEFFNKRVAARDISGYFHLKRGEFAYNRSSMAGYPYGAIKRLERYSDGALSTLYLCFALRKPEALDPDFASHLLDSGQLDSELAPIARVGARAHGLLNVTPAEFFEIQCSIPPLPEQKKIAAILGAVDAAIQATQAVIDQTRRVKAGLLQTLLTRGIGHTRFKKTAIGEIPESWAITTPGELANFTGGNGFRPKDWSDSGRPIIRIQNLNGSQQFNYYDGPVNPRWLIPPGELLFAWAGSAGASFGPTIWPGPEGVLNQHIYRITPRRGVVKRWLYYILQLVTGRIEARAHGFKTTLLHVHKSDITDQPIPLPPAEEQAQIVSRLMTAEQSEEHAMSALTALQKTKAGLLQDLLTGAVRVTP
ncbi:MAG: restriction endonuclease subunit S [Myxococcales bacterium]|nr:restriction endonuclease subunit S [Myxococcales bacterium]